jgi:pimeloyl-ACP methyl ester carboxylesterase
MTTGSTSIVAEAPGAAFTQGSVTADGFTVRYFEAGTGSPIVVLHGAGGPRFTVALDLLAESHRVILIEMPGWGDEPNTRTETLAQLADTVAEAVAAIGIERYHLLGTSMGGATAVWVALNHPERLISLVLEAPATFRVGATPPGPGVSPEEMVRRFRVHPERVPAFDAPDPAAQAKFWPLVEKLLASRPEYDEEVAALLPSCSVRTLVLFGDEDGIVPAANGRIFRRLLPNSIYLIVHQAAHDIQGDRAEAFAETVGDFVDRGLLFFLPETPTLINP